MVHNSTISLAVREYRNLNIIPVLAKAFGLENIKISKLPSASVKPLINQGEILTGKVEFNTEPSIFTLKIN